MRRATSGRRLVERTPTPAVRTITRTRMAVTIIGMTMEALTLTPATVLLDITPRLVRTKVITFSRGRKLVKLSSPRKQRWRPLMELSFGVNHVL